MKTPSPLEIQTATIQLELAQMAQPLQLKDRVFCRWVQDEGSSVTNTRKSAELLEAHKVWMDDLQF
ncbi:hypothetical protein KAU11_08030 [Candidatus Babeliales bacterium]|nr:hypothetical protein [Candidatus Babeliales bacterium]